MDFSHDCGLFAAGADFCQIVWTLATIVDLPNVCEKKLVFKLVEHTQGRDEVVVTEAMVVLGLKS